MAYKDYIVLPAAAAGVAVVAGASTWTEGSAATIGTPSMDFAIHGIEIQCEDATVSPDQDTTIEVEFLVYVAGVLKAVYPKSMRYDTNAGFYLHDPMDRGWWPEPMVVPAGSAITITARVSDTSDRNWRVKVRGYDQAIARIDSDTVTLTLTPSFVEVAETVDSDTILLTLTLEGVEERVSEDADTIPLVLTPELTEEYVPGVSGTEYEDSGTVPLVLTASGVEERVSEDSGTITLALTPSGTDVAVYRDYELTRDLIYFDTYGDGTITWDVYVDSDGNAVETGGQLVIEPQAPNQYYELDSPAPFDLEGGIVTLLIDQLDEKISVSLGFEETVGAAFGPDISILNEDNTTYQITTFSGADIRVTTQPVGLRIRDLGGEWSQEYTLDGTNWIGADVVDHVEDPNALHIYVGSGRWVAAAGAKVYLDSITVERAVYPILLTLTPSGTDTFHTVEGAPSAGLGIANVGRADLNLGNTPTTITLTTGVAVPAGSRIYVGILVDSGSINDDMSDDDLGLTWVKVEEALDPYSQSHTALFYADTSAELALGTVISVTVTGGWAYVMVASSFTGTFLAGFTTTETGNVDDATWEGTISPSGPALVVTAVGGRGTSAEYSSTPDSGTIETNEHERTTAIEQGVTLNYKIVDTAGSTTLSGTFPAIFNWSSVTTESGIAVAEPVYLTLTPTLDEEYTPAAGGEYLDSGTALLILTASGIDVAERADAVTILLTLTASGIEQREITDAQTAILVLTPSATEIREIVDTGTIGLTLSPSASEVLAAVESGTVNLQLTPSGVTQREILEAATIPVTLTASGVDVAVFVEVATILLDLTASGFDEYTGATAYTDSDTIPLTFTTSGIEERVSEDSATTTVNVTISYTEGQETYDSGTIGMVLSPTGVDTVEAIEVSIVDLRLAPSGTETLTTSAADTGEVYVDLQPTGVEITTVLLMELSSRAYLRWQTTTGEQNYTSYSYVNWKSLAVKRWNSDDQSRFH